MAKSQGKMEKLHLVVIEHRFLFALIYLFDKVIARGLLHDQFLRKEAMRLGKTVQPLMFDRNNYKT